jgi:ubiquitin-protein ligase E3 C
LNNLNDKLKGTIRVELTSSNGLVEAGIDGGGVFKEFFTELIKTAYNTEYGLFKETADRRLYPNPQSNVIIREDERQFEFLGKILGKAVYENILVELPLANFFLAKLLGKYNYGNISNDNDVTY